MGLQSEFLHRNCLLLACLHGETVINQEINAIYLASNEAQHGGAFATSRPESQNPERRALGPYRPVPIPTQSRSLCLCLCHSITHREGSAPLMDSSLCAGKDLLFAIICNNFREQSGPRWEMFHLFPFASTRVECVDFICARNTKRRRGE